jgi:hypothetical protein
MTAAITLTVAGVVVLTSILDDPFRGDVHITPESMEATQQLIAAESGLVRLDSAAFGHLIGGSPCWRSVDSAIVSVTKGPTGSPIEPDRRTVP